jgi:B12-binding domain/radical SAM domain protein
VAAAPLTVVLDHRQAGKQAFNVLAGALETQPDTAAVPLVFVTRGGDLALALRGALATSARVLCLWSFYSPEAPERLARLGAVRTAVDDPRVVHVAGGVHATARPAETLAAGFDLVALGEGERTVVELVRAALAPDEADPRPALRAVAATAHLDARGELVTRGRAAPIDLDAWPPFAPGHGRLGPIELTRGCIYACGFCQTPFLNRARFRHRSVENTVRWVRHLVAAGFRDYRFITPTSLSYGASGPDPDLDAVERLLRSVRAEIGPSSRLFYGTFPSEVRPEHVSPAALAMLRRYVDNRSIIIGGQSGSDAVLARTHRGHDAAVIERAVAIALEAGFEPHVDFIFGLPGEGPEDVEATLALAERLVARGARAHGHTFMPLPGTPLQGAPPGVLSPATRHRLDRLATRGGLYGQWERQAGIAADLARGRAGPRVVGGP